MLFAVSNMTFDAVPFFLFELEPARHFIPARLFLAQPYKGASDLFSFQQFPILSASIGLVAGKRRWFFSKALFIMIELFANHGCL